jgi:ABC-2 type transport system ATP-binding protein
MVDMPPVLEIRSLAKAFGSTRVLEDIDVRLGAGERLGLSGPNGSGKTTLLRCIAGTVAPSAGTVTVAGHPGGSLAARAATGGALAHEKAFYQRLSGLQNLRFYAALRASGEGAARAEVDSLVGELELTDFVRERVDRYSSGMYQQLGLARALLGKPKLIVLDEPTRSLDSGAVERFWAALDRRPDLCIVIASHRGRDLERCSRRIDLS